jgi:predicted Holliday junction resolvase-like endonuclease
MSKKSKAKDIVKTLEQRGFYAECPNCEETIKLKDANLFYLDEFKAGAREVYEAWRQEQRERRAQLEERRKHISVSSELGAQATNTGLILERLAPCMDSFRYEKTDCRSLFDPIDYLIFEGLSKNNAVSKIFFTEIKTGGAQLKPIQTRIRSAVRSGKVSLSIYKPEKSQ